MTARRQREAYNPSPASRAMARADLVLLVLGVALAPIGVFLATWEVCVRTVLNVCVERGVLYQAPGLALLILGILLFLMGAVLLATGKGR